MPEGGLHRLRRPTCAGSLQTTAPRAHAEAVEGRSGCGLCSCLDVDGCRDASAGLSTSAAFVLGEDFIRIGHTSEAINGGLCVFVCQQSSVLAGSRFPFCLVASSQDEM